MSDLIDRESAIAPTTTPTTTPTAPTTDTISRRTAIIAAIVAADEWDGETNICRSKIITRALKAVPSAQTELIRCKDCTKYDTHDHRCKHWNHGVVVNDWCSRAERK